MGNSLIVLGLSSEVCNTDDLLNLPKGCNNATLSFGSLANVLPFELEIQPPTFPLLFLGLAD